MLKNINHKNINHKNINHKLVREIIRLKVGESKNIGNIKITHLPLTIKANTIRGLFTELGF